MSLSGNLEDLSLPEILNVVGISGRSGLLRVESRRGTYSLLLRLGHVIAAKEGNAALEFKPFLVKSGVADDTHLAVLELQARRQGTSLVEILASEGQLSQPQLRSLIEASVLTIISRHLDGRDGTFRFTLLDDVRLAAEEFGGLLLEEGVPAAQLPGVADRIRTGSSRDSRRDDDTGSIRRRVELLVSENEISLPMPMRPPLAPDTGAAPSAPRQALGEPQPPETEARPRGLLLLFAVGTPALRKALLAAATEEGHEFRVVGALAEAELALETALNHGAEVVVIGQASHATAPGLELLARVRSMSRAVPTILISDQTASSTRQAAVRDRAERLGATHVLVVPPDADADVAAIVIRLATAALSPLPAAATAVQMPRATTGPEILPHGDASSEPAARLADLPRARQAAHLGSLARGLAASEQVPEIACAMLEAAAEYFPRCALFTAGPDGLQLVGVAGPPAGTGSLVASGGLTLGTTSTDIVGTVIARVRAHLGPLGGGRDDRLLAERLGMPEAGTAWVHPIGPPGGCIGALYGDDAGAGAPLPATEALASFLGEVMPLLSNALAASRRRAEARRARRSA